jgi:glycosyltransferase involved in cell wall biosynthesis
MHDLSVLRFPDDHPLERVKAFERHFLRSLAAADHILTDTEAVRAELCAFAGLAKDRVSNVPLGVDPVFRPLATGKSRLTGSLESLPFGQYGLCVSTLEPRKRIGLLLDAWRELPSALRARHPLLLVGAIGWNVADLMDSVLRGCDEGWLYYAGYVDEGELPRVFAGARLFVFPSRYEGFGLPPLEAMACGVPTIVAHEHSLVEVTSGAALVTEPDDLGRFRDDIALALQDEGWRSSAIAAGIEVASRYTWRRCVSGTVQAYQLACGL